MIDVSNDDLQSYRVEVGEYHGAEKRDLVGDDEIGLTLNSLVKSVCSRITPLLIYPGCAQGAFRGLKTGLGHQLNLSIDPRPQDPEARR